MTSLSKSDVAKHQERLLEELDYRWSVRDEEKVLDALRNKGEVDALFSLESATVYFLRLTSNVLARIVYVQGGAMQKKLTITVDEEVYAGLYHVIGPRKISKFVQELVRPHVVRPNLESAYADMAKDTERESEAAEWAEATFKDVAHEKG